PTPQPMKYRNMFATRGKGVSNSSVTFVSQAAMDNDIKGKLGLEKIILPVKNIRQLTKKDMKLNTATPKIDVDPQTYEVKVDGKVLSWEPVDTVPMGQQYFLFRGEGMIVEEVVDNIHKLNKAEIEKRHQEKVYLESSDLLKRIQRVKTDHDRELGIRLKNPIDLEAGDILYMDDDNMIVIDVFTDDVLVLHPKSINEMGNIAHQLGNRHLPAQFEGDEMLVQY